MATDLRVVFALVFCASLCGAASAQPAPAAPEGTAPSSPRAGLLDQFENEIRLKLLAPNGARANFVAGALEITDRPAQVAHFSAARTAAPQEKLYLASLALSCFVPMQPPIAQCGAVDRLADWARRDDDNSLPYLLLAERARKRNEREASVAYIAQAASLARFDDYAGDARLALWDYVMQADIGADRAIRGEAVIVRAPVTTLDWPPATLHTCFQPDLPSDAQRIACEKLGNAMAAHGSSVVSRTVGAAMAERNADAGSRPAASAQRRRIDEMATRCTALRNEIVGELESDDAAARSRALERAEAVVRAEAAKGEGAVCGEANPR
jgi:hypothetical protein